MNPASKKEMVNPQSSYPANHHKIRNPRVLQIKIRRNGNEIEGSKKKAIKQSNPHSSNPANQYKIQVSNKNQPHAKP